MWSCRDTVSKLQFIIKTRKTCHLGFVWIRKKLSLLVNNYYFQLDRWSNTESFAASIRVECSKSVQHDAASTFLHICVPSRLLCTSFPSAIFPIFIYVFVFYLLCLFDWSKVSFLTVNITVMELLDGEKKNVFMNQKKNGIQTVTVFMWTKFSLKTSEILY